MALESLQQIFNNVYDTVNDLLKVKVQKTSNIERDTKTIGTTEVELFAGTAKLSGRNKIHIKCIGDDTVYVGETGVTTNNGYPVLAGKEKTFETTADLYAIAKSEQEVRIIEEAI